MSHRLPALPASTAPRPDVASRPTANSSRRRTLWLFALAVGFFGIGGSVTVWSTISLLRTREAVDHSREVLAELGGLAWAVSDVSASSRGFALTGREAALEDYQQGSNSVVVHLQRIKALTVDNPGQQQRLIPVRRLVAEQAARAAALVEARRHAGLVAASLVSIGNVDAGIVRNIQSALVEIRNEENSLLDARRDAARRQTFLALVIEVVLGALSALIVALAARRLLRERQALARAEQVALDAQAELGLTLAAFQARTSQLTILSELSSVLGICLTLDEFYSAVAATVTKAAPGCVGALGVINNSRTLVEIPVSWGSETPVLEPYPPEECCALRGGRPFGGEPAAMPITCSHGRMTANHRALCVPLNAQGETLGALHVWMPAGMPAAEAGRCRELVASIGEHLALALANLKAHDALRHQATRDPLTGAFNRRFMVEALERELMRARRPGRPVGLLMLDVDHFKQFNDQFGHQAGDEVLKLVVQQIRDSVRAEDYVCRYGGEEFAVVLPEADAEVARERADQLRRLVERVSRGREGGAITVSIGVAVFPEHGTTGAGLISRADGALYAAKRAGRNRVVVAAPPELLVAVGAA